MPEFVKGYLERATKPFPEYSSFATYKVDENGNIDDNAGMIIIDAVLKAIAKGEI